jgi:hypothetical protein
MTEPGEERRYGEALLGEKCRGSLINVARVFVYSRERRPGNGGSVVERLKAGESRDQYENRPRGHGISYQGRKTDAI